METQDKLEQCVAGHCSQGCGRVSGYIAVKAGQAFPEVTGLSREERRRVLQALGLIMAVYAS